MRHGCSFGLSSKPLRSVTEYQPVDLSARGSCDEQAPTVSPGQILDFQVDDNRAATTRRGAFGPDGRALTTDQDRD
jgi:hypothetical protein